MPQSRSSDRTVIASGSSSVRFVAVVCVVAFVLIGGAAVIRPMFVPDEARYGEVARQALDGGHWIVPHINGVPHLTKPPLYYDAAAVAMAMLGRNPFAPRVVSLVCFLAMVIAAIRWAERRSGRAAGRLTALVLLTMVMPVAGAQFGDLNTMLAAFVTIALLWLFDALEAPERLGRWYAAWAMLALAVLTKGPVALMFPALALLGLRVWRGRLGGPRAAHWFGGMALLLALGLPWYVYIFATEGRPLLEFWWGQLFHRTGVAGGEGKEWILFVYYVPIFLGGTSLWGVAFLWRAGGAIKRRGVRLVSLQAPGAVWRILRGLPPAEQYLLGCVAGTLLAFAIMRAKMPAYILPILPAFGILVALGIARQWGDGVLGRAAVRRLIIASAALTYGGLWLYAILMRAAMMAPGALPEKLAEDVHPNIIARMIAERRDEPCHLYQVDEFDAIHNFYFRGQSILVEETIHDLWPGPPELVETLSGLRRLIHEGRPMLLVVDDNDVDDVLPEGEHPNVRVLFEGESETLLSTLPADVANPALPRRPQRGYD